MVSEPAFWGLRRRALDVLHALHLAGPAVRAYELLLAAKSRVKAPRERAPDGLPLPPARLRAQVGPRHADAEFFLRSGRQQAEIVRTLVSEDGRAVPRAETRRPLPLRDVGRALPRARPVERIGAARLRAGQPRRAVRGVAGNESLQRLPSTGVRPSHARVRLRVRLVSSGDRL